MTGPSARSSRSAAVLLASLAVAVLGCSPAASPSATSAIADLGGSAWTIRTINGGSVIANAPPTMSFSTDGHVSGSTGCNEYSALYSIDGERLTIGGLGVTQKLCEGAHGEQETAFLNGLGGAASWHATEPGHLEIDGAATLVADTGVVATKPPPTPGAPLAGTSWDLAEMGGTADFAHLVPTIDFGLDGSVSGFAGCNTFSGPFRTDGGSLTLGPLATTEIGCQRPASEVESTYLAALAGVSTWSIGAEGVLLLGGAVPLRFAAR
jgi:heat shock protein HslJ